MEPIREARSGSSTPLRHTGLSSLSRNLSLPKAGSTAGSEDMRRNIEEKEQELQKLNAARVSVLEEQLHGLEEQVSERDTEIENLQEQLVQLTEDFRYNLKLLEERDAELERTEASLDGHKKGGQAREAELMETRHKLDEVQQQLQDRSSHASQQEQQHSQAVARLTQDLQQEQQASYGGLEAGEARFTWPGRDKQLPDMSTAELQSQAVNSKAAVRQLERMKHLQVWQQEGKASAGSIADLKASAARELAEMRKQAKEQLQQSGSEAQVKLAAVQTAREALQGQVEKLQDSNGALHQQLADSHGKIESQAVESARMLEQFEGSVAALREIERQYGSLQEQSQRGQQASAGRIADLEREAGDSRDIHLALAAQRETQIAELSRELSQTTQKLEAMQRLYEAESAVARQSAEHSRRDSEQMGRLEGRLAEALALTDAAEQAKDHMEQQLRAAQASEEGSTVALEREIELHTQTQAEKLEAQQQAEECRAHVTGIQAEMHSLRIQIGHAATRPAHSPAPLQPLHNPGVAACHPLQSVLGARSDAGSSSQQQQWFQEGSRWQMAGGTPNKGGSAAGPMSQGHAATDDTSELRKRVSDLADQLASLKREQALGSSPGTGLTKRQGPAASPLPMGRPMGAGVHQKEQSADSPRGSLQTRSSTWSSHWQHYQPRQAYASGRQTHYDSDNTRRHSADDVGGERHIDAHQKHKVDDDLMRQQQRMIDLLKLRSDQLSAENDKLQLRVDSESKQRQHPEQLPNDYISSHAAMSVQRLPQMQHPNLSQSVSQHETSRVRYTGYADRLAQAGGLSAFPKTSDLSRLREQVMTAKDQLLQLDMTPMLATGLAPPSTRPRNALLKRMQHMPPYA
ncbi:TPA: Coiled-coil domain-containing protein 57 [Trebouxia sp. C0004]